ncbi:PREDICTED: eukaryotic translation initiation factor 4G-like [Tarenaya hassleriana]|uniref:eukaryotic translation initiation factor 4G-like n=1 Tax=Tarenaya hassleriana TaxID=28532 RepID=UPI00053C171E|nr:PREDICTED: eukaryotic translation initiation factor 4G-like [Tarenaya hassleriana]
MSYNQSRSDRGDTQYRRTGRLAGYHQQQQQRSASGGYGKGGGSAASAPARPSAVDSSVSSASSFSSNRSFKKPGNVLGGQSRVNLSPANHSVSKDAPLPPDCQNGSNVQSRSQVISEATNQTDSYSTGRSIRAIPKAPTSQSSTVNSKTNEPSAPAKASADASKAFSFQFGSLGPDLMKIPARTSSAPPNLDEQKHAQMHQSSFKQVPDPPSPVLKQDLPNKVMDNHSINKEAHATAKEKRDVQVAHVTPPSPTQKPTGLPIRMPSVQTPYQHPQVPHPVHFGGPNMHLPPQNVSATPFQMPMPMALSMGNTPQIQQQMFLQGLQSHPMPHQGMMHQAQGMGFATPIGAQIHPQLGHMGVGVGVGVSPHHEQHGGKFGGQRKVTPVKITHPDTHEELRLDRRGDNYSDSRSVAAIHPNMPPRSQPVPSFAPRPVNYMQSSYNTNAMFPPVSVPLNSSPMTSNSQAPRFNFPAQGSQSGQVVYQSAHSSSQLIRPTAPSRSSSVSSSAPHERDSQYAISSGAPATAKVTVKPAAASEKLGSPQVMRSSGEVNISYPQKNVDSGSMSSSQQMKPGSVSGVSTSFAPPATSSGENAPVAKTETGLGETVDESNLIEDHQKQTGKKESPRPSNEDIGQVNQEPQISDYGLPSDQLTSETINPKEDPSLPPTNGLGEELVEESSTSDNSASDKPYSNVDRLVEDSTPVSSEISGSPLERIRDARGIDVGGDLSVTDKHTEMSEISVEQPDSKCVELRNDSNEPMSNCSAPGNGTAHGGMDGTSSECPGSEKVYVTGNLSSVSLHSADTQCSNVPSDHSFESNMTKNTTSRGKKKKKEILQKADAAGTTSDLYMAYKGPEKKKETAATPSESSDTSNPRQALVHGHHAVAESPKAVAQVKNEPEDWEDAVDVSSPNLGSADYAVNAERGDEFKDIYESMEKKYSRDFLLKFADQCTSLPEGFEVMPDIADLLICANVGASHLGRDSYGSPGKVMDRQGSASRLDRRSGNVLVDDRWMKTPGSFGSGYGGNVGFRPGQGGNSGVLKNPRVQAPIISRAMQSVGPIGGMGRNSPESAERWQRAANFQQKGLIPSPHTPLQVMHRAEKKYEVGKVADEEEAKQRQLKGILNKLTPQNFEKLFEQVKSVNIENIVTLKGVISQIFDKALMEPTFCEMYADFCQQLSSKLPDFTENGEKITFKRLLLNKCQEEFERGEREEDEASRAEEGEVKQTSVEREEKRLKARRRMLGNIRLIGELYKKRMLTEKIMHECIKELLGYSEDPDEENIEALCKLMSTIGEMIDQPKAKALIDAYFGKMTMLSNKQELSSRMRFMLKDSIDLRKNKWQQRRKVEGPKKIEEVHRDAAQERHTQTSRLTRGPISSSMRKGPSDFGPRGGMLASPGAQIGNYHGLPQGRGFGNQDARFEERTLYDGRTVPMPQRTLGGESITLGPQGGLGQGMSFRRPAVASSSASQSDISPTSGDLSRAPAGLNGFGPHRPASPAAYGRSRSSSQEQGPSHGIRDSAGPALDSDLSLGASSGMRRQDVSSTENVLSEERLHDMSMAAIKEFYSARDEKEVGLCITDLNSPGFHPTMISLWVTDSFERKDMERDLLAKLLINLVKSPDGTISEGQLVKGFESVLTTLEDAVNDAPRAAEFLGRILGKVVTEKVVPLAEIGRLIQEGGEEPGSIVELGLGGDVIGSAMETIKSETGEAAFDEIRRNSGLRLEEFKPREPNRSKILDKFT